MSSIDYSKRLIALKTRRTDDYGFFKQASIFDGKEIIKEAYEKLNEPDIIKYVVGAMQNVDERYTEISYEEAERIINHLKKLKDHNFDIDFKFQGSVTNDTHIKFHSDIDILTLNTNFITLEPPLKPSNPYNGNPIQELRTMRNYCYLILKNAFPKVDVDNTGAKSITLTGGSLRRKIDVVVSNWYDTVEYNKTNIEYYRGIQVLDIKKSCRIVNKPFLHNQLLAEKDNNCHNNYKKIIRLLKTLKVDADTNITISSYDIAALMYHFKDDYYKVGNNVLLLIKNTKFFIEFILKNKTERDKLKVPDDSRHIFLDNENTLIGLNHLYGELCEVYNNIEDELRKNYSTFENKIL